MIINLLVVFLMAPAIVLVIGTALRSDDRRTQEALLYAAVMWYGAMFCIAGIIYIFNTLTTINSIGG